MLPNNITLDASDMVIYVEGEINICKNANIEANIYAPNAVIFVSKDSHLKGSFIGKEIMIGKDTELELLSTCWLKFPKNNLKSLNINEENKEIQEMDNMKLNNIIRDLNYTVHPNPFNNNTTIKFTLPEDDNVKLEVYNYMGQSVAVLFNGNVKAGQEYNIEFKADELPEGVYFGILQTSKERVVKKMLIMK